MMGSDVTGGAALVVVWKFQQVHQEWSMLPSGYLHRAQFGNGSISMREVVLTRSLMRKNIFIFCSQEEEEVSHD